MTRDAISPDSTLEELLSSLATPEEQVRSVLATMGPCRKAHGNAHVRIGVTGEGKAPYHKVFYRTGEGTEELFGTYYGERRDDSFQAGRSAWSTRSSSYEEIQTLIGSIRGYAKGGASHAHRT